MNNLKISIVTISYNAKEEIEETILSIINQGYNNLEYILVDGGSSDGTVEIIKKYVPLIKEKCVSFSFVSEKDKGISDAFNKGILRSTGDVIALINAGDGLMPGALQFLNDNWKESDQIVYGKTLAVDKLNGLKYLREIPDNINLDNMVYNGLIFTHQSSFVKKEVYDKFGLYDTTYKFVMDSDLFMHFYYDEHVEFRYMNCLFVYMLCGGVSANFSKGMLDEQLRISKKYGGYSEKQIRSSRYKSIATGFVKDIIRRIPWLWYMMIGPNRRYHELERK